MQDHVSTCVIQNRKVLMDKFVIEFDLIFSELVVVSVYFVYELPIEVDQFFEFFFQQTSHTFLFTLFTLLLSYFRS